MEILPPSWVPAFPPRVRAAARTRPHRAGAASESSGRVLRGCSRRSRRCAHVALNGQLGVERLARPAHRAPRERSRQTQLARPPAQPLPTLDRVSADAAGQLDRQRQLPVARAARRGSFFVYLPPGYASTTAATRSCTCSTATTSSPARSCRSGFRAARPADRAARDPADDRGDDPGRPGRQQLAQQRGSRTTRATCSKSSSWSTARCPTIAARDARAIAGDSMGGYGAMNIALVQSLPLRRRRELARLLQRPAGRGARRPAGLLALGLRAFLYGAESDHIANPAEDAPFAAALRAAGARAKSAIYPGEHSLETIEAHLESVLAFAGHALAQAAPRLRRPLLPQPTRSRASDRARQAPGTRRRAPDSGRQPAPAGSRRRSCRTTASSITPSSRSAGTTSSKTSVIDQLRIAPLASNCSRRLGREPVDRARRSPGRSSAARRGRGAAARRRSRCACRSAGTSPGRSGRGPTYTPCSIRPSM